MRRRPQGLLPLATAMLASGALQSDVVAEICWLKAQLGCPSIVLSPGVWAEALDLMANPDGKRFSGLEMAGLPAPQGSSSLWVETVTSWGKGFWRRRILEGAGVMLGGLPERPGKLLAMGVLVREGACVVVPMLGTWDVGSWARTSTRSSAPQILRHMARSIAVHDGVGMAKNLRLNAALSGSKTSVGLSRDDARVFVEMQVAMQVALLLRAGATLSSSTQQNVLSAGELQTGQQERMIPC